MSVDAMLHELLGHLCTWTNRWDSGFISVVLRGCIAWKQERLVLIHPVSLDLIYPPVPSTIPRETPPEGSMIGNARIPGNVSLFCHS